MRAKAAGGAAAGLLAGAAVAVALAACAGRETGPAAPSAEDLGRRQDIGLLWSQIREWRVQAGLPAEPVPRPDYPAIIQKSVDDLRLCPEDPQPKTATCQDVCKLKDAICDNADSICRIAGELGDDAWAAEKCQSAKASCKEATEKCCDCAATEEEEEPAAQDAP